MIRKRVPQDKDTFSAECFACKATYTITGTGNGNHGWKLDEVEVPCNCGHSTILLRKDVKEGSRWTCASCKGINSLVLVVAQEASGDPS